MGCRICTANDREALIDDLARAFWESGTGETFDDRFWEDAGSYWRPIYRGFAERALLTMEGART